MNPADRGWTAEARGFRWQAALACLVASFLMVVPALDGAFLDYDDELLLAEVKSKDVGELITEPTFLAYLPVYALSMKLDTVVFGDASTGYHVVNVLWHAAAGYVLFLILALFLRRPGPALIGALLFVVHPLHVESVAWIAGRKDVLSGFLLLMAWLVHLKGETGLRYSAWWAGLFLVLAGLAKGSVVVFPGLLLVVAWLAPRYEGRRKEEAIRCLPYLGIALVLAGLHYVVAKDFGVVTERLSFEGRVASGIDAWAQTLWRTVLPFDLSIDYPEARLDSLGDAIPSLLGLLAVGSVLWFCRRRAPYLSLGLALFFVGLAPFNGVFPATTVMRADRYAYLPLLGLGLVGGWLAVRSYAAAAGFGLATGALVFLSLVSSQRFESSEALWDRTIEARDDSAVAYVNRGLLLIRRAALHDDDPDSLKRVDSALVKSAVGDLRKGLQRFLLLETRLKAQAALVVPLLHLDNPKEALAASDQALEIAGRLDAKTTLAVRSQVRFDRGLVYQHQARLAQAEGKARTAMEEYARAAAEFEASTQVSDVKRFLELARTRLIVAKYTESIATVLTDAGQHLEANKVRERAAGLYALAIRAYRRAEALAPEDPRLSIELALAYRDVRQPEKQREALEEARRRDPKSHHVAAAWAEFWLAGKKIDEARKEAEALPPSPQRTKLLGEVNATVAGIEFRKGDLKKAVALADAAREQGIARRDALYELGHVYQQAGRFDDAVACFRESGGTRPTARERDAIARAYAYKAYRQWQRRDPRGALSAMRAALAQGPDRLETGGAVLRGEIALLASDDASDDHVLLALAAIMTDTDRGERVAARILDGRPSKEARVLALRLRGLLRAYAGDIQRAESDLQEVVQLQPKDRWGRFRLAQLWQRAGAGRLATGTQAKNPELVRQGRQDLARAVDLYGKLLEEDEDFMLARVGRGTSHFVAGNMLKAEIDFGVVAERVDAPKEVHFNRAELRRLRYTKTRDRTHLDAARSHLVQAYQLDPNDFRVVFALGNVYHLLFQRNAERAERMQAFHLAAKWYLQAMAINPRDKGPRVEYAALCLSVAREAAGANEYKSADQILERAEARSPDVADVALERIRLNLSPGFAPATGREAPEVFEEAEAALGRAATLLPDDPRLPLLRAEFHRRRGGFYFIVWFKLLKDNPEAAKKAAAAAVEDWGRALELDPENRENGRILERLGQLDPEKGRAAVLRRAEKVFTDAAAALSRRDLKRAEAGFRETVRLCPYVPHFRFALGEALFLQHRYEASRRQLEQVANHELASEKFPTIYFYLGSIYRQAKKPLIAKPWFERFLKAMKDRPGHGERLKVQMARKILEDLAKRG